MFFIRFSSGNSNDLLAESQNKLLQDNLSDWERDIWTFTEAFLNDANNSFSVFTSGSTGKPKLIKHTRQQLVASALATINFFNLQKGNTALLAIPAAKIGGRMMIVRSILAGLDLCCVPLSSKPFNGITIHNQFDFAPLTPMQLLNSLNDASAAKKIENINTILLGGGEVSNVLLQKIQSLSSAVFHSYGMTETASHIAIRKLNGSNAQNLYHTLEGIDVATNENNCLVISAPHFSKEPIITNDVVSIHSSTSFEWLGRIDNTINTGGIKIQAEIVEQKLFKHLKYRFFFTAEKDDLLGEKVVLAIESSPFDEKELNKLKNLLNKHLEKFERPKKIAFVYKFRETETGKIQRKESLLHVSKNIEISS
jgi:O-succinylbenzoic acid--CoA ligase